MKTGLDFSFYGLNPKRMQEGTGEYASKIES
jgi:hypothetical protein